jgi:hypothetical protein
MEIPMAHTRITFNGTEYESPGAMPPEVRSAWEEIVRAAGPALRDGDGNGVPDVLEGGSGPGGTRRIVVENRIIVNGRTGRGVGDMPPEVRRLIDAPAPAGRPANIEGSLRVAVFVAGAVVVLALAAWAALGR